MAETSFDAVAGALNSKIFFEEYSQNPNSMGMYDVPFKSGYILLGAVFTDPNSYFGGAGIEGSAYMLRMSNYAGDNKSHTPCHAILIWLKT